MHLYVFDYRPIFQNYFGIQKVLDYRFLNGFRLNFGIDSRCDFALVFVLHTAYAC